MGVSLKMSRCVGAALPAVWCFSRSVNYNNTNNFCMTNTDGSANNANAYNSGGRAPGFHNPHFGVQVARE